MGGIGMGGVIVSVLCIITTAGSPDSDVLLAPGGGCATEQPIDWSAFMYFSLSSIVLLSNIGGYLLLQKLPITKYYESHGSKMARPVLLADSATIASGDGMSLRQKEIDLH